MPTDRQDAREALRTAATVLAECTGARVRTLNRVVTRIYDDRLRSLGIKFSQLNILMAITARGPMAPNEIAGPLKFEKSTLSRNLRILEDRGWIDSRPAESGNRVVLASTAAGRRLVRKAGPLWREAQEEVGSILGKQTTDAIRRAFERLQKSAD